MTVWVYTSASKEVGDVYRLRCSSAGAADRQK